jgi:hypothetical protein
MLGDSIINDILKKSPFIDKHKIVRYVDDIYVFMKISSGSKRDRKIMVLGEKIADALSNELSLKINYKTEFYNFLDNTHKERFKANIRDVSLDDYASTDERDPNETLGIVLNQLSGLKSNNYLDEHMIYGGKSGKSRLKDIFSKPVMELTLKPTNVNRISEILSEFDFSLVKYDPKAIISIIHSSENKQIIQKFQDFLEEEELTNSTINMLLIFWAQEGFSNERIVNRLKQSTHMKGVLDIVTTQRVANPKQG